MSDIVEDFREMKRLAEQAQREKNMAEGEKAALLKRLDEEFGYTNIKDAKAALAKKEEAAAKLQASAEKKKKAFMEKYGDNDD